jgi:hypothetical protein
LLFVVFLRDGPLKTAHPPPAHTDIVCQIAKRCHANSGFVAGADAFDVAQKGWPKDAARKLAKTTAA